MNQARGGQGFGIEAVFPIDGVPTAVFGLVVGGECAIGSAASYIIGTAAAPSSCDANAQTDYSEIYDPTNQTGRSVPLRLPVASRRATDPSPSARRRV